MSIVTKGLGKGPLITQGYGLVSILIKVFRATIQSIVHIKRTIFSVVTR